MDATAPKTSSSPDERPINIHVDPLTGQPREDWKPLPGFESRYKVSNLGHIWDNQNGQYAKLYTDKNGEQSLMIRNKPGSPKKLLTCLVVHRAVAQAFIPNPNGYDWVFRRVRNGSRNEVSNLYWGPSASQAAQLRLAQRRALSEPKLPFIEYTLDRLLREGKLTPDQRSRASVITVADDSMSPQLSEGSQIVIAPVEHDQYDALTGVVAATVVAVILKADCCHSGRFYCYLGRFVSADAESVRVSRDNPLWSDRIESRSAIAGVSQVMFILNKPVA